MRYRTADELSPISRMQRGHYGGLGFLGAGSVGAPVGQGAGSGAATGAAQGASIGAVGGPIFAAVGAVIGAIGGAIAGAINKPDPENVNFTQAVALWQQNPDLAYQIANKYLVLAGLFDLTSSQIKGNIPIYKKYGRMGEGRFVTDLVGQINSAVAQGKITASDTPLTIMSRVVQPWIDSFGFGAMQDTHADLINRILIGMILDYVTGAWKNNWFAIGGQFPFSALPPFALAPPTAATAPASPGAAPAATGTAAVPTAPPPPTQTFGNDGATITVGATGNVAVKDSLGNTFQFGAAQAGGIAPVIVNGTPVANAGGALRAFTITIHHGIAFLKPTANAQWGDSATTYAFVNGSWQAAPDPVSSPTWNPYASPTPAATGPTIPPGYQVIATDIQTGLPVYGGPDQRYYQWTGSALALYSGTASGGAGKGTITFANGAIAPPQGAASTTTVPLPAGYGVVAVDASSGLPIYASPTGLLTRWDGTTMTPYTGTASTSNGPVGVSAGVPLVSTSTPPSGSVLAPQIIAPPQGAPINVSVTGPSTAPLSATPAAAGVTGAGLPPWVTWGAVAAGVALLFATARPVGPARARR